MRSPHIKRTATRSLLAAAVLLACAGAQAAATIKITSRDPAGVGFNDPTPVAPVGGNPGTTLGEQRMNVYKYVAGIWEQNLDSSVTITVNAGWEALTCDASSAVLGSAGAWNIWYNTPGAKRNTWYPQALANKLAGVNLSEGYQDETGYGDVDIKTQFNVNLGKSNCLAGSPFYLGLDGNAGNQVNFVETLLHELGHGLGFSVISVNTATGNRINAAGTAYTADGLPSIWEGFMYDNTLKKTWLEMTSAQRKASAVNPLQLAWTGPNAVAGAAMLARIPVIKTTSPGANGNLNIDFNTSTFGPLPPASGTLGTLAVVATQAGELGSGCSAFNTANTMAVKNKVALMSRGGCNFAQKVKNAQDAGAVGAVLANNTTGALIPGGTDGSITIPAVGITQADGENLKAAVASAATLGSRSKPGTVTVALGVDPTRIAGADAMGRPLLYTPAVLASGSSVSHWDVTASPNLLMEPNINPDLGIILTAPKDLTVPLLKDIGW
ncbi:PA domain-containing protein [uncultured Massilia sp.]|uniref:PA domain-containing protein n=1 Tax=uncultured Massilia sp. TaxID=169973 RepID=UPI0025F42B3A|nr:PA domain-containing protein [uncultured Massilia sp.]